MSTNVTFYVNTGTLDAPYGESGTEFTEFSVGNDSLIFSGGSDVVKDGEPIPGSSELNQAGVRVSETAQTIVDKYFLADISDNELKEIHLAGNQDSQYVFCFSFDGATASEPVLELWDDEDMDTTDLYSLGEGTPANSWWKGIVTTSSSSGDDWTGINLAGSSVNHFLQLNDGNGALTTAKDLYCNLKIVIPANPSQSSADQPVFVIKYASN